MLITAHMSGVQGNTFFTHNNLEVSEGLEYKLTNSSVQNLNHCPCAHAENTPARMQMKARREKKLYSPRVMTT